MLSTLTWIFELFNRLLGTLVFLKSDEICYDLPILPSGIPKVLESVLSISLWAWVQ